MIMMMMVMMMMVMMTMIMMIMMMMVMMMKSIRTIYQAPSPGSAPTVSRDSDQLGARLMYVRSPCT